MLRKHRRPLRLIRPTDHPAGLDLVRQVLQLQQQQVARHVEPHTNPLAVAHHLAVQQRQEHEAAGDAPRPSTAGGGSIRLSLERGQSTAAAAAAAALHAVAASRSVSPRGSVHQLLPQGRPSSGSNLPLPAFHSTFTNPLALEAEEGAAGAAQGAPASLPTANMPARGALALERRTAFLETATSLEPRLPVGGMEQQRQQQRQRQLGVLSPIQGLGMPRLPSFARQRSSVLSRVSSAASAAASPAEASTPAAAAAAAPNDLLDTFLSLLSQLEPEGSPPPPQRSPQAAAAAAPTAMPWDAVSRFEGAVAAADEQAAAAAQEQPGSPSRKGSQPGP